jgi:hypothetical protein
MPFDRSFGVAMNLNKPAFNIRGATPEKPSAGLLACAVGIMPAAAQSVSPPHSLQQEYLPMAGPKRPSKPPPPAISSAEPSAQPQDGASRAARLMQKFRQANTTNDGRLTLEQAQAAGLNPVVRHFAALDPTNKGYVTPQEIRSYAKAMRATRAQPTDTTST